MTLYALCFALFLVGLYGLLTKRDLIKIILSSGIMGYAGNLMLVLFGDSLARTRMTSRRRRST